MGTKWRFTASTQPISTSSTCPTPTSDRSEVERQIASLVLTSARIAGYLAALSPKWVLVQRSSESEP